MLAKAALNHHIPSHHHSSAKDKTPAQTLPTLNLLTAPKDTLPASKDVQLKSGVLYETTNLPSVLNRMTDKKHPPLWLMLEKQSDSPQNTPDKVVLLDRDSKGKLTLSFTDIEGHHSIPLGHVSSKASKMDKLAQKIHDNINYVRHFMNAPDKIQQSVHNTDNDIGIGQGRLSVALNKPGIPGLKLLGPPTKPTVSNDEIKLTGAARWPNKELDTSHSPSNQAYSSSMWRHARVSGKHIKEGNIASYRQLWRDATDWRLSTIKNKTDPKLTDFILPRSLAKLDHALYITPLHSDGPYAYMKDRFIEKAEHYDIPKEEWGSKNSQTIHYTDYAQLGDKEVDLNRIYVTDSHLADQAATETSSHQTAEASDNPDSTRLGTIHHTAGFQLNEIMDHVEHRFQQALSGDLSLTKSMENIAEIHWWITNSCPDFRGSAAKAEFCARAMSEALGIELAPFKDGILPDLEAMAMSKEDFVKAYPSLLERPPL